MEKFKEDRKLDNRRIPCDVTLVHLEYYLGEAKIREQNKRYISRSGYCLDPEDKQYCSVNYHEIGRLYTGRTNTYYAICYPDEVEEIKEKIRAEVRKEKIKRLAAANQIPDSI